MHNTFNIVSDEEGKRIDLYLSEKLSLTRTKVKSMIDEGFVHSEGKPLKPSSKLTRGMRIEGEIPEEKPLSIAPQAIPLEILYEDRYILAVNKPNNMVVHPSVGHSDGTLVNAVLAYLGKDGATFNVQRSRLEDENVPSSTGQPEIAGVSSIEHGTLDMEHHGDAGNVAGTASHRPGVVHRLDKGTTGVILLAKDTKTQDMLSALFKKRSVRKTYRAVVEGVMKNDKGLVEGPIGRHPVERKKMAVRQEGREASTGYRIIKQLNGFTYVEAYPATGRTHQIRVHMAHIGHPIVGDGLYGRHGQKHAERPLLHAYMISFPHPATNVEVVITAPVPDDIEEFAASHEF